MIVIFMRTMGLLPLLVGLYLIHFSGKTLLEAYQSTGWSSTEGVVLSSKIALLSVIDRSRRNPIPIARVEYSYTVAGKTYTSTRISLNDYGSNIKGQQKKIINGYPEEATVKVFYDPQKPGNAILEHRTPFVYYFGLGGGIIFTLIGYLFIFKLPGLLHSPQRKFPQK